MAATVFHASNPDVSSKAVTLCGLRDATMMRREISRVTCQRCRAAFEKPLRHLGGMQVGRALARVTSEGVIASLINHGLILDCGSVNADRAKLYTLTAKGREYIAQLPQGDGQPVYANCTQPRRWLVRHNVYDLNTGRLTDTGRSEWVTGPCDKPLFLDEEKRSGRCRSCASGWTHPENYPVKDGE